MRDVEILDERVVFDDIFQIQEARLRLRRPDGGWSEPVRCLSFERGDSVAALIRKRGTGDLVLVEQFRYPTWGSGAGWLTEIVAGSLEQGEAPEEAIRREVREETGYSIGGLRPIATFYVSPGGSSERVFLYYGEVSEAEPGSAAGSLDVEERHLRVVVRSPDGLWEDFRAGRVQDGKTLIALLWLRATDRDGAGDVDQAGERG